MSFVSRMSESADLVAGMATRLDIDFADRIAAAPDTAVRSFASMVMRCTGCRDHAACRKLQDENLMLDAAPDYCRNRDVLIPPAQRD